MICIHISFIYDLSRYPVQNAIRMRTINISALHNLIYCTYVIQFIPALIMSASGVVTVPIARQQLRNLTK